MVEFKTIVEHLEDLILGKEKMPFCSGTNIWNHHEPTEWTIVIGKHTYGYGCHKCGYGQGGSLRKEDAKRLGDLLYKSENV